MMIIEDKLINKLHKWEKVNNNLIYIVDIEIEVIKIKVLKKGKVKEIRKVNIFDKLWENNPGKANQDYFNEDILRIVDLSKDETMEIKKIILKKEIACSSYKR